MAKVDRTVTVSFGARADEAGTRTALKSFAIMSVFSFDATDTSARERYTQLAGRAQSGLARDGGLVGIVTTRVELSAAETAIAGAKERTSARRA